jgi:hypothetical protein
VYYINNEKMEIVSSFSNLSLHDHKKSTYLQQFLKHDFKTKQVIVYLLKVLTYTITSNTARSIDTRDNIGFDLRSCRYSIFIPCEISILIIFLDSFNS